MAAFGYHAGFAGAALGLQVWADQIMKPGQVMGPVKPYPNEDALIAFMKAAIAEASKLLSRKAIMYSQEVNSALW